MVSNENNVTSTVPSNTFGFGIPNTISDDSHGVSYITYNSTGTSVSAGADGDDDDDDTSSVDVSDDESTDEDDDDYTPPSKEEYQNLLAEKRRADSESAARKRLLRQAGLDPKTGKPVKPKVVLETLDDDDDDDDDSDTSADDAKAARDAAKGISRVKQEKSFQRQLEREVAKTERRVRDQSTVLIAAIPTALNDEGWNGKNLSRILKLIDMDNVSVDDDGEVDGLTDEIDELKKDFPEFFKRQRMKDAAKEVADTKTVGGGTKQAASSEKDLTWTEQIKKGLYGQ